METVLQDLRLGFRALRKQPGFAALVSVTLALAIGVNTIIFSFVSFFILRPLPFKDMDSLVFLSGSHPDRGSDRVRVSYADYLDWRASLQTLEGLAAFGPRSFNLTGAGEPVRVQGQLATASLFPLWGLQTVLGRPLLAEDDKPGADRVVLLSHGFWQRRFGSEKGVLGRVLTLDGQPYTVVGVVTPEIEIGNFSEFDVWLPLAPFADPQDRAARTLRVNGRLKPTSDLAAAAAELRTSALRQERDNPATHSGWGVRVVPLRSAMTSANSWVVLALLSLCVSLVLAIACANVANLMLARGSARLRDTAVRAALGATRARLLRQLLTEAALLSLLGGALGLLLAEWGLLLIRSVSFEQFYQLVVIDQRVLVFSIAISLVTPLVFGLVPALQASREDLVSSLRDGGTRALGERAGGRTRRALVVVQMTLAASLLVVAGLSLRSAHALQRLDPGYDIEGLLTFRISLPESSYDHDEEVRGFYDELLARLRATPGARATALGDGLPVVEGVALVPLAVEGVDAPDKGVAPSTARSVVSAGYLKALGIRVVAGRELGESDVAGAAPVAVVSRAFVKRYLPGREPLGARIRLGPPEGGDAWREVVGVAEDLLNPDVEKAALPQAYVPLAQAPTRRMVAFVRTRDPEAMLASTRREVARLDPTLAVYESKTVERALYEDLDGNRVITGLFAAFAAVALCLATIGLYGVVSYGVAQRTREFGVRMALGAQARDLLGMVLGQGARLVLLGLALGLAGGAALARTLAGILYGVTASDPLTFGGVVLALGGAALLATLVPALRALRSDPLQALRAE